ncbi:hypothetical protein ACFLZC_00135 [Patescibacteria group bacterium]
MKRLPFFLSWLIFEKILKRPPAKEAAAKVRQRTLSWNETHKKNKCTHCGGEKLLNAVGGNNGLLSFPYTFYRCADCGNEQKKSGRSTRDYFTELKKKRLITDDRSRQYRILTDARSYRYRILSDEQWIYLVIILILLVTWLCV